MYRLSERQKAILAKKIRYYKKQQFPGKGSGIRLAEEIGVPPQTVSNWLNGSRQPTAIQLFRLAIAFKVSPLELCGFQKNTARSPKNAEVAVLHDLLTMIREAEKSNVNPHITEKALNDFKNLLDKALLEITQHGKEDKI